MGEVKERRKEAERISEEIMAKHFPNFMKPLIYTSKKLNKLQEEEIQSNPHLDTL